MKRINVTCNDVTADLLLAMLEHFKELGELGCTREIRLEKVDENEWVSLCFDGDGDHSIEDISQEMVLATSKIYGTFEKLYIVNKLKKIIEHVEREELNKINITIESTKNSYNTDFHVELKETND